MNNKVPEWKIVKWLKNRNQNAFYSNSVTILSECEKIGNELKLLWKFLQWVYPFAVAVVVWIMALPSPFLLIGLLPMVKSFFPSQ